MRLRNSAAFALAGALALAACGTPDRPRSPGGRGRGVSDPPMKVGAPYRVGGRTYVPADDRRYDATGYASWYGGAHRGRATANGERFDPDGISAAHTTLPLPSYVEVTALDTGRTILVRVNDRGPFADGRIIDLSQGAARLLGVERAGIARVRVRRVEPGEAERAALRAGRAAGQRGAGQSAAGESAAGEGAARSPASVPARLSGGVSAGAGLGLAAIVPTAVAAQPVIAPPPTGSSLAPALPAPAPARDAPFAGGGTFTASRPADAFYVQVAALADADRADGLAAALRSIGPAEAIAIGPAWRVRLGPFAGEADALSALARARQAGYQDARILRESAR